MYKFPLLFIFLFTGILTTFSQFTTHIPVFTFADSLENVGTSPIQREAVKKNHIIKVLEYREPENKKDSSFLFKTYNYDKHGNLTNTKIYWQFDTILTCTENYKYDNKNKLVSEYVLNIDKDFNSTSNITHKYLGDSVEEITCYHQYKNKTDTSYETIYFDTYKRPVKYTSSKKEDNLHLIMEYVYDLRGQLSTIVMSINKDNKTSQILKDTCQYITLEDGKKITIKSIGALNENGISVATYNAKNQCIDFIRDWPKMDIASKNKFTYNTNGTLSSRSFSGVGRVIISKYYYYSK